MLVFYRSRAASCATFLTGESQYSSTVRRHWCTSAIATPPRVQRQSFTAR